jgi:hypothetical protein
MKHGTGLRLTVGIVAAVLLGASTGCTPWLMVSNLVSLGGGWLLHDLTTTTTTETQCYRNGALVDCSELPIQSEP